MKACESGLYDESCVTTLRRFTVCNLWSALEECEGRDLTHTMPIGKLQFV